MKDVTIEENMMMYRDLDDTLKKMLRNMCNWGFIYIGRTGIGLTYSFKKEYYNRSGKALEEAHRWLSDTEVEILTVTAFEGPKWVPYKRIEDVAYLRTTITTNPLRRASPAENQQEQSSVTKQEQEEERTKKGNAL